MSFIKLLVMLLLLARPHAFAEATDRSVTPSQNEHLQLIVEWMKQHDSRPPKPQDFGPEPHQIPLSHSRLTGCGLYQTGGPREHLRVFPDSQTYWRSLKHFAARNGIKVTLLHSRLSYPLTPQTRHELQEEALDLIAQWMKKTGKTRLRSADFGKGKIPITYARLVATGDYRRGAPSHASRIFDFRADLDEGLRRRLVQSGTQRPSKITSPKEIDREDALDLVLRWIEAHGGRPALSEFQLHFPFTYEKLVGLESFDGIFASPAQFWLELHQKGQQHGINVPLLDIPFKELSPELRDVLRLQAIASVSEWIRSRQGRIPRNGDFGTGAEKTGVPYHRVMGTSDYAPGGTLHALALFQNAQHFWLELHAYAHAHGIHFRLLDVQFRGELSDELKTHLQNEALERTIEWMEDPRLGAGQRPTEREMFTRKRNLPVVHGRLFMPSRSGDGKKGRVFDSFEAFDQALTERWEERQKLCAALLHHD